MKPMLRRVVFGLWIAGLATPAVAQAPDAALRSTPDTVIWGYFSADLPPALTIKSGQTVKIDTVSHQGLMSKDDPATFFGSVGIPPDQVLQDAKDIYAKVSRVKGLSAHVLTGPIYVEGAERATCWRCASTSSTCGCPMG
jgi:acetamidase/formamidase